MSGERSGGKDRKPRPPLNREKLQALALHYVGRYATSRARLGDYLRRKVRERGWSGELEPPIEELVRRVLTEHGRVDVLVSNAGKFWQAWVDDMQKRGLKAREVFDFVQARTKALAK